MSAEWYKATLLIGSNIFFIPPVVLSIWYGFPLQFSLMGNVFVNSVLYHSCHVAVYCLHNLATSCGYDYVSVWTMFLTSILLFVGEDPKSLACFALITQNVLMQFSHLLPGTLILPIAAAATVAGWTSVRLFIYGVPVHRQDPILFGLGVLIALPGLVFMYSSTTTESPNYWWGHPLWHMFIGLSATCFVLTAFGESLSRRMHATSRMYIARQQAKNMYGALRV